MSRVMHPAEKVMAQYHLEGMLQLSPRVMPEDVMLTAMGDELFGKEAELLGKDPVEVVQELTKISREQVYTATESAPAIMRHGDFERQENQYRVIFRMHVTPPPQSIEQLEKCIQESYNWYLIVQKAGDYQRGLPVIAAYIEKRDRHQLLELDLEPDEIMKKPAILIAHMYKSEAYIDPESFTDAILNTILP